MANTNKNENFPESTGASQTSPRMLHSSWSGIAGLTVEVDETHSVLLVSRNLRDDSVKTFTVTNGAAFHAALDAAMSFRDALVGADKPDSRHLWQGWGDDVMRCTRCGIADFSLGSRADLRPCTAAKAAQSPCENEHESRS